MIKLSIFAIISCFTLGQGCQSFQFSCRDHNNNPVDWFMVYKMPDMTTESITGASIGLGYYYLDSNTMAFNPSPAVLNGTNHAIYHTMQQIYKSRFNNSVFHVMYNDQEPDPETAPTFPIPGAARKKRETAENFRDKRQSSIYAHAKGVAFFDKNQGVWVVHSIPLFPPRYEWGYPASGSDYGQSMLCRTFNYDQLPKIGKTPGKWI